MNKYIILVPVLVPVVSGTVLGFTNKADRRKICRLVFISLSVSFAAAAVVFASSKTDPDLTLFNIASDLPIYFSADFISRLFSALMTFVWLMAAIDAFEYMKHEKNEKRFFSFYLIAGGMIPAVGYAGNLITFYLFFELMTITSVPLVLHSLTKEAVDAGLKYLFYSLGGAFLMLFGFFVFSSFGIDTTFTAGGTLLDTQRTGVLLLSVFFMIVGFGTKAGMFPMHGWLPSAHPVAPAPASAVLSGVITKAGVLGIIRCVFYIAGADYIRGTWVQYAWALLAIFTVFMGSMLAYGEKVLKKRLAYSTLSQVSYILFGLSLLNPISFVGAVLHLIFHCLVKNTLFLSAGAIIFKTGKTRVDELRGIGKEMPVTIWCFLIASVTLIGIPPTSAFISKWYLAAGALDSGIFVISVLGPAVLLISAVLTALYLLPIAVNAFLPGADYNYNELISKEPTWRMLVPLLFLAAFSVALGIFPSGLIDVLSKIAQAAA